MTDDLTRRAVLRVFGDYFDVAELEDLVTAFDLGKKAETGSEKRASEYPALLKEIPELSPALKKLTEDDRPEVISSAIEFILEGLHLNRRLNCERAATGFVYRR